MAVDVTNYKCPGCGGPLHYVGASNRLECDFCGSAYEPSEMEAMMAEAEKQAEKDFAETEKLRAQAKAEGWETEEGMKAYDCPSCGAEFVCDETTIATCCPYCGNPTVIPGQVGDMLKPDYIIPFKLNQEQAKYALRKYYQGKKFLPSNFANRNQIDEIKGVYVPFWLYDGKTSITARYEATKVRKYETGDKEITETEYYDVMRGGEYSFEKVPVDASSKMPDNYMDAIEPFDYRELKPYSNVYLPGFLADKYDETAEKCQKRVDERAANTARELALRTVKGYDNVKTRDDMVDTVYHNHSYALFPTYLLSTRWNGKSYLFAMNGQSGKLIGNLPIDWVKYGMWFGGVFLAVVAVFGTVLGLYFCDSMLTGYGIGAVLGLALAFTVCGSFKNQMTTARKASQATSYVDRKGFILLHYFDKFTHRTETERIIEQNNR